MGHPTGIPERLQHRAIVVELDNAPEIDTRAEPFVGWNLLHHAQAEFGIGHREIVNRRSKTDERKPILAVGSAINVVGITRKIIRENLERAGLLAHNPVAIDATEPCAYPQHGAAVVRDADAVRKSEIGEYRASYAGRR